MQMDVHVFPFHLCRIYVQSIKMKNGINDMELMCLI